MKSSKSIVVKCNVMLIGKFVNLCFVNIIVDKPRNKNKQWDINLELFVSLYSSNYV